MFGVVLKIFVVGSGGRGPLIFRHLLGSIAILVLHHSVDLVPVDIRIVLFCSFSYFIVNVGGVILGFYFVVMMVVTTIDLKIEGQGSGLTICLLFI